MITHKETKKTEIIFGCNLSYNQVQKYLYFLLNKNAIEKRNNNDIITYKTTTHGEAFLRSINATLSYFS